ncbi:MAG: RNA polymerase sigma factor [Flavobacteriales bacterium]|nr:RNA polymerase sigma factor [Flavobacteriales bacterium]
MAKESDEDIVRKIVETNEHELFGELYERYKTKVYHKCISFSKDQDEAKDLLHDVFLKTFTSLSRFSGRSSFSTWLYSITYNYCVDYARSKRKRRTEDIDERWDISDKDDEKNERELMSMHAERLGSVLDRISPNEKAILLMKYQDGFSIKEIMGMLELSESAVKMRIKRAKASALENYQELFAEDLI